MDNELKYVQSKDQTGVSKLSYYYFDKKDMVKFQQEFLKYFGGLVRHYLPTFNQETEEYYDFKLNAFVSVWEYLTGKRGSKYIYDPTRSNFLTYLHYRIRGEITLYISKFNNIAKFNASKYDVDSAIVNITTTTGGFYNDVKSINYKYNLNLDIDNTVEILLHSDKKYKCKSVKHHRKDIFKKLKLVIVQVRFLSWIMFRKNIDEKE